MPIGHYERKVKTFECSDCKIKYESRSNKVLKDQRRRCPECSTRFRGSAAFSRDAALFKLYGITQYTYNLILKDQNNVCAICEQPNNIPKALSVDHNHTTGKIRGLLCAKCNLLIGNATESVDILTRAIAYLRKHNG